MNLHDRAKEKIESAAQDHYKLGEILSQIQEEHVYEDYGYTGTSAFYNYCEEELGYSAANANNHIRFYKKAIEFGVNEDELYDMGFHSFLTISQLLTHENKAEWINLAKTLSVRELRIEVKKVLDSASALIKNSKMDVDMNVNSNVTVGFKFKYLDTEADFIQKALSEADLHYGCDGNLNLALQRILQDYATIFHNKNITLENALNIINDRYNTKITLQQAIASKAEIKEGAKINA